MKLKTLNTAIVAAVMVTAGPASANHTATYGGVPVYTTIMFSDATKTTVVGRVLLSYCDYDYLNDIDVPVYRLLGTSTVHQQSDLIGYCFYTSLEPIH